MTKSCGLKGGFYGSAHVKAITIVYVFRTNRKQVDYLCWKFTYLMVFVRAESWVESFAYRRIFRILTL